MILDSLTRRKSQYEEKYNYYRNIGFDTLAADFEGILDLIEEMENYIKEKENGKD
jgi:hypothetical protein